jgi:GTP cyclohydrolase I
MKKNINMKTDEIIIENHLHHDIDEANYSWDSRKSDKVLGKKIQQHLIDNGVETPMTFSNLTAKQKVKQIEKHFSEIMRILDLDLKDDSLIDTPKRVAKMYVNEIFWGLNYDLFPKCTAVENKMRCDEMVIERNINVQSNCEHHFVIIDGVCDVAYIPDKKILGLSKLNRIVEFFSKRPQIQERLTSQIYFALENILETQNIAVRIRAQHYCVKSRGIQDVNSDTITSKLGGVFKTDPQTRNEFLNLIRK